MEPGNENAQGAYPGGMSYEEWDKILDAKLLYNLYDDFECRLAAVRTAHSDEEEYDETADREEMERLLKALVMFAARCLATCDTALVITKQSLPNTIMLTYIEHLIFAYHNIKGYHFTPPETDEE